MKISQLQWTADKNWMGGNDLPDADLVLAFGDHDYFHSAECFAELRKRFPKACIAGCSSSGNVQASKITDKDIVATAVRFEHGRVRMVSFDVTPGADVAELSRATGAQLKAADLRHVLVFSDGLFVNGTKLALGLKSCGVTVTGGLAGDAERFGTTWVMANEQAQSRRVVLVGLYGEVTVNNSHCSGWTEFGAERIVTKSVGNVVSEIDGQPALALYKKYLGDLASSLPGSGMRFPLNILSQDGDFSLTRTLLAVNEAAQSLTFAGDVPQGSRCKLMRTNLDHLIESADIAAQEARPKSSAQGLCVVVSCVGRRIVLGQLTEEELEAVERHAGAGMKLTGFYSYGELAPVRDVLQCHLHNQTMSLTTIQE